MASHSLRLAPERVLSASLLRCQSDDRLVALTREGHERAFEEIVERYRRPLLRHCRRVLPPDRAEDAVQQAFFSAYEAIRRSDSDLALRPWLHRIAHNAALNGLRQPGWDHDELGDEHDGVERPDQVLERREALRSMVASVNALPARQRSAVVLSELDDRSHREIAAEMGVSDGAVRQLIHRARVTLRAGATAATPIELLLRLAGRGAEAPVAARVAELTAGAGVGATAAKAGVAVLMTGAIAGGAVHGRTAERAAPDSVEAAAPGRPSAGAAEHPLAAPATFGERGGGSVFAQRRVAGAGGEAPRVAGTQAGEVTAADRDRDASGLGRDVEETERGLVQESGEEGAGRSLVPEKDPPDVDDTGRGPVPDRDVEEGERNPVPEKDAGTRREPSVRPSRPTEAR